MKYIILCVIAAALAACASPPKAEPEFSSVTFKTVTVTYLPLDQVDRVCERKIMNAKTHWGCASYHYENDTCAIVAAPPREKYDIERSAVIGVELANCVRMKLGQADK